MRRGHAHAELDEAGEYWVSVGPEEEKEKYVKTV